jgi:RNA polymerase sigma-70 factor, ECF subfamily
VKAGTPALPFASNHPKTDDIDMPKQPASSGPLANADDTELVGRTAGGDHAAFEALMRRYNGKLFRVARAILRDDTEAEDALQESYLQAYRRIGEFRGNAQLATWLTRIVVNQSLMQMRRQKRNRVVVPFRGPADSPKGDREIEDVADNQTESPSNAVLRAEVRRMLERRIDELPVAFRTVFVMREVEDMTVQETAACLSIPETTVRTRLFRARAMLRQSLERDVDAATADIFGFAGAGCDRIVANVLARLSTDPPDAA